MKKLILSVLVVICLISCSKNENSIDTKIIPKEAVYGKYIGIVTYTDNYSDSMGVEPQSEFDTFVIKEQRDFYTDSLIISKSTNSFSIPDTLSGYDTLYTSTRKKNYQLNSTTYIMERDTTKIVFDGLTMKFEKKWYQYYFKKNTGYNLITDSTPRLSTIRTFLGIKSR